MSAGAKTEMGPSERENRRLLLWSGVLGGVIGAATAIVALTGRPRGGGHTPFDFVTSPLPAWFALLVVIAWGVVLPIISWRWHRVVDEHEREAYRDGAVAAFYVIGVGAPCWWFLWRGGMAPPVDAGALYAAMMVAGGGVWLWRKYR